MIDAVFLDVGGVLYRDDGYARALEGQPVRRREPQPPAGAGD